MGWSAVCDCGTFPGHTHLLFYNKIPHFLSMRACFIFNQRRPLSHARIQRGACGPEHPLVLKNTLWRLAGRLMLVYFSEKGGRVLCLLGIVKTLDSPPPHDETFWVRTSLLFIREQQRFGCIPACWSDSLLIKQVFIFEDDFIENFMLVTAGLSPCVRLIACLHQCVNYS